VSVIVSARAPADSLAETLDSVYAQEGLGSEFEIEVIQIDRDSNAYATGSPGRYQKVRHLKAKESAPGAAWNAALATAEGKYIAFLEATDLWAPRRLLSHLAILETQAEFGAAYGQTLNKIGGKAILFPEAGAAPAGFAFEEFLRGVFVHPSSLIIRKEVFEKMGSFDETLSLLAYYDMLLRLAFHTRIAFISSPVAITHAGQKMATETHPAEYRRELLCTIEKAIRLLPNDDRTAGLKRGAIKSWFLEIAGGLDRPETNGLLRNHIFSSLRETPWIAADVASADAVLNYASKVLFRTTQAGPAAVTSSVREFCRDLKETYNGSYKQDAFHARRLLGDTLTRAAKRMWHAGNFGAAGYTATYAICQDLTQIPRQLNRVSHRLLRSLLAD
jgi:hypothetical protein